MVWIFLGILSHVRQHGRAVLVVRRPSERVEDRVVGLMGGCQLGTVDEVVVEIVHWFEYSSYLTVFVRLVKKGKRRQ